MLDLNVLIADDMSFFDYLESGLYRSRQEGDTFDDFPEVTCLRRVIRTTPKVAATSTLQQDQTTWHVKNLDMQLLGLTPKLRDRILSETGQEWWVMDFALETLGTRWRLTCNLVKN